MRRGSLSLPSPEYMWGDGHFGLFLPSGPGVDMAGRCGVWVPGGDGGGEGSLGSGLSGCSSACLGSSSLLWDWLFSSGFASSLSSSSSSSSGGLVPSGSSSSLTSSSSSGVSSASGSWASSAFGVGCSRLAVLDAEAVALLADLAKRPLLSLGSCEMAAI
jgi:hypothetical protein